MPLRCQLLQMLLLQALLFPLLPPMTRPLLRVPKTLLPPMIHPRLRVPKTGVLSNGDNRFQSVSTATSTAVYTPVYSVERRAQSKRVFFCLIFCVCTLNMVPGTSESHIYIFVFGIVFVLLSTSSHACFPSQARQSVQRPARAH